MCNIDSNTLKCAGKSLCGVFGRRAAVETIVFPEKEEENGISKSRSMEQ